MNENEIKDIVDDVVEELHDRGYIKDDAYGRMPAAIGEEIAEKLVEKYNE